VVDLLTTMNLSERLTCWVVGRQRSTQRREPASMMTSDSDAALRGWLRDWAKGLPSALRPMVLRRSGGRGVGRGVTDRVHPASFGVVDVGGFDGDYQRAGGRVQGVGDVVVQCCEFDEVRVALGAEVDALGRKRPVEWFLRPARSRAG
jgi:hypothetical protein